MTELAQRPHPGFGDHWGVVVKESHLSFKYLQRTSGYGVVTALPRSAAEELQRRNGVLLNLTNETMTWGSSQSTCGDRDGRGRTVDYPAP